MGGRESGKMSTDTVLMSTDTTPFALPFIGGVVLAVPSRVPQNYDIDQRKRLHILIISLVYDS